MTLIGQIKVFRSGVMMLYNPTSAALTCASGSQMTGIFSLATET